MPGFWARIGLAMGLSVLTLVAGLPVASADSGLSVPATGTRTLVGSSAGALENYNFTVPAPVAAPTVTVTFSPATLADGKQAGFVVRLSGTQVGTGSQTAVPGVLSYTLPANPSGIASVQVFAYSTVPSSFTVQSTGVPAGVANGPATNNSTADQAASLNGTLSESLAASTGGTFAFFAFPSAGASPPSTVSLTYSPADARVAQAVGFNILDAYGNNIGSAVQPAGQNQAAATLTYDLSRTPGEPLSIQVFNYAPGVQVTYHLSVSGIAPAFSTPAAAPPPPTTAATASPASAFQPFWVENFVVTPIWSGADSAAISFGNAPQFSSFLVVRAQTSSRLYVFNPRTGNYGYVDAAAVGPSGPPRA
jgi:hypothetical protein